MDTRGLRHLKDYLGEEGAKRARAKGAVDVVPVLSARKDASPTTTAAVGVTKSAARPLLSESVMEYLEARLNSGAAYKLSRTQLSVIKALTMCSTPIPSPGEGPTACMATANAISVTRGKIADVTAMVDTLALSALELAAPPLLATPATAAAANSLFVLTDNDAVASQVAAQLQERYGLRVLLLDDTSASRHPTFPSPDGAAAPSSRAATQGGRGASTGRKRQKTSSKSSASADDDVLKVTEQHNSQASADALKTADAPVAATVVVVVVATPKGFLTVDRRSAIWKFISGYAIVLRHDPTCSSSLWGALQGKAGDAPEGLKATSLALNTHRWDCLGHVGNIVIIAAESLWLARPELELLTTLRIEKGSVDGSDNTAVDKHSQLASSAVAALRSPVTVHYAVLEGIQRFQFLFSLLKGLVPCRGLVLHVATRESATFLYDVLYSLLPELPPYVQLLSDYEGASAYTAMHTAADRERLCATFDNIVISGISDKTSAVLVSCHGLVPRSGTTFLQYDIIPDIVNYAQFIAEVVTPGAEVEQGRSAVATKGAEVAIPPAKVEVRRERTVCQRKRSLSPVPASSVDTRGTADSGAKRKGSTSQDTNLTAVACRTVAHYRHVLLLLRPNEVAGCLRHLRQGGTGRYRLDFREMASPPSGRYLFIGEKMKSMNRKLFAIQNAAYYAYKATMRVYCTVGPRDVYDETKLHLEKVAEEFGFTELPLLDLRLKDTAFRPKEDYYRAARQKADAERRSYKKFAQEDIVGEEPAEHVADMA